LFLQHLEDVFD